MRNFSQEIFWDEPGHADSRPSEQTIDVGNGDAVLDFVRRYLEAHSWPVTDEEIHNVMATVARYKGPQVVAWAALESFLAGLLTAERAL